MYNNWELIIKQLRVSFIVERAKKKLSIGMWGGGGSLF